jgi:hypothetical protein
VDGLERLVREHTAVMRGLSASVPHLTPLPSLLCDIAGYPTPEPTEIVNLNQACSPQPDDGGLAIVIDISPIAE